MQDVTKEKLFCLMSFLSIDREDTDMWWPILESMIWVVIKDRFWFLG